MKRVYLCVFITAFFFSTMEVALKLAGGNMDSFQLTFLRFLIGGLMLLPFALAEMKKNNVTLSLKDYAYLLLLGILCIPLSMLFFQLGVMRSNASTSSVLICINPFFVVLFAHFLTDEKITATRVKILLVALVGIFFMVKPWNMQEGNTVAGVLFMMLAALFFGLYTVLGKISIKKMGIMAQTSISFLLGSLVLLVIIIAAGRPVFEGVVENWAMVAYIGIFVTGVGYYSFFDAIKHSDAATGSMAFFLKPAMAPVFAVIILGDKILWNTIVGILLILVASYLNIRENRRKLIPAQ